MEDHATNAKMLYIQLMEGIKESVPDVERANQLLDTLNKLKFEAAVDLYNRGVSTGVDKGISIAQEHGIL